MTPLSEMTLHQLCAAIARNVYREGGATDESLALDRELSRRQRMLDAAEGMAGEFPYHNPGGNTKAQCAALAAYQAAKENR